MRTLTKRTVSVVMTIVLLVGSAAAKKSDWSAVERLAQGQDIWIETRQGEKYQGQVYFVSDSRIVLWLQEPAFPGRRYVKRELPREDVQRVRLNQRGLSALVGAAIGMGAGIGIGAAVDAHSRSNEDRGLLGAALGILMGAGGALIGKEHPFIKGKTVYEAP